MANLSILKRTFLLAGFAGLFSVASVAHGQTGKAPSPANWDKVVEAARHEGVEEYLKVENQSEEKLDKVRDPARKFACSLLKSK